MSADTVRARRALESRELEKARVRLNITQRELADATGRPRSTVSKWEDPTRDHLPNMADVSAFPLPLREWYARREAAKLGLHLYALPELKAQADHFRLLAEHAQESAELMAAHSEALADGVITPDESRRIRAEAIDVLDSATRTIASCDEALRTH